MTASCTGPFAANFPYTSENPAFAGVEGNKPPLLVFCEKFPFRSLGKGGPTQFSSAESFRFPSPCA